MIVCVENSVKSIIQLVRMFFVPPLKNVKPMLILPVTKMHSSFLAEGGDKIGQFFLKEQFVQTGFYSFQHYKMTI